MEGAPGGTGGLGGVGGEPALGAPGIGGLGNGAEARGDVDGEADARGGGGGGLCAVGAEADPIPKFGTVGILVGAEGGTGVPGETPLGASGILGIAPVIPRVTLGGTASPGFGKLTTAWGGFAGSGAAGKSDFTLGVPPGAPASELRLDAGRIGTVVAADGVGRAGGWLGETPGLGGRGGKLIRSVSFFGAAPAAGGGGFGESEGLSPLSD